MVPPVERRTCSIESCKQQVMFPGERCQLHASQTGTPPQHPIIQRGPVSSFLSKQPIYRNTK